MEQIISLNKGYEALYIRLSNFVPKVRGLGKDYPEFCVLFIVDRTEK